MKIKKAVTVLVLLLFAITVINSCGGGGGGVSVSGGGGGGGGGGTGSTTTVSGKVTLSSTLGKPGLGKAGIFESVLSAVTGTPMDNAIVEMYDADHPEWIKPVASALTGGTGNYKLDVLTNASLNAGATYTDGGQIPAGNYTLLAHKYDLDSGRTYIAVQGYVKHFAGDVIGQDLEAMSGTKVPEVQSMFGLEKNFDGTYGSSSYVLANNAAIQTTFNTAMARKRLVDALSIKDGSNTIPGIWKVSADLQSATFYSSATLTIGTIYTVMVSGGTNTFTDPTPAISLYAIPLLDRVIGTFQAGGNDKDNPTAIAISPATTNNVLIGTPIQIASDDPLDLNTFVITSSPSIGDKPSVRYAGTTSDWGKYKFAYTIVPDTQLLPDTSYNIVVSGSKDLAGNPLNTLNFSFGTESAAAAPIVTSATPTGTNAPVTAQIKAKFSATLDSTTVNGTNVLVTEGTATGTPIAGTVDFKNNEMIFTPSSELNYSKKHTVTITTGIKSLWGISMAAPYPWSFTTAAPPDNTPPTTTASPAGGTYGASQNVTLTCNDNSGSGCDKIYYTTNGTEPTTLSAIYGAQIPVSVTTTLKFFAKDLAGNAELVKTEVYTIDTSSPVTTATPAAGIYNSATNVTLSANKQGSTIYFTTDNSAPTTSSPVHSTPIPLPANSITTIKYFAVDTFGHAESSKSAVYTVDTLQPTGTIVINGGATRANSGTLTLTLSATDNLTGIAQMAISNDNFSSQVLSSYATVTTWTVIGQGTQTVYVKFKDGAGNWSNPVSSSIIVDTTKPAVLSTAPTASAAGINIGTTITATFSEDMDVSTINVLNFIVKQGPNTVFGPVTYDAATKTATFTPAAALGFDTAYTVTIKMDVKDLAGNTMTADKVVTFTTQAAPPISETTASPPGGNFMVTSLTVTLTASDASAVIYYTTTNVTPTTGSPSFIRSGGVIISSGTTTLQFYSQQTGTTSHETIKAQKYVLDTTGPTGSISISGSGAGATNATSVTLNMSMTDSGSGVDQMRFSNDGSAWTDFEAYQTTKAWNLGSGITEGSKTVYAQFKDKAGNVSGNITSSILYDITAPVLSSCNIENNAVTTNVTTNLKFYRTITDTNGAVEMRFFDGVSWPAWSPIGALSYNTTNLISNTQGLQTISYEARDAAGNIGSCSDTIYFDTTPPSAGTISVNNGAQYSISTSVSTTVYATDVGSYVSQYRYTYDGGTTWYGWYNYPGYGQKVNFTLSGDGTKTVQFDFKDAANYVVPAPASDTIILDTVNPSGSISINGGAVYTNSTTVTLGMSYSDATSGVNSIHPYISSGVDSGWITPTTSMTTTIPSGDGWKYANMAVKDNAGRTSTFSDSIFLDQTRPVMTSSTSPASCSTVGTKQADGTVNTPNLYVYLSDYNASGYSGINWGTATVSNVHCYDQQYNDTPKECGGIKFRLCMPYDPCYYEKALASFYSTGASYIRFSLNGLPAGHWHFCQINITDYAGNTMTGYYRFYTTP